MSTKKQPSSKVYKSKFLDEWLDEKHAFSKFIKRTKSKNTAFCTYCNTEFSVAASGAGDVTKHTRGKTHKKKAEGLDDVPKIEQMPSIQMGYSQNKRVRESEIIITSYLVEHNVAFNNADHLTEVIKKAAPDSAIAKKIKICRTKATAVSNNVIGEEFREIINETLKRTKFSLMIDESTNISADKYLCLVVRFFDTEKKTIVDRFYDLILVDNCTAEALYLKIVNSFVKNGVPYKENLIGLGSDGASVMSGCNNSVSTMLNRDMGGLFYMKCICHTFNLVSSDACEELPRFVEDLIRNIYNYIQGSPKRIQSFKQVQELHEVKPHKMLHPSATRWLSVLPAVKRVLQNYNALLCYFEEVARIEKLHTTQKIYDNLKDPQSKFYLTFLNTVLPYFQKMTLIFQRETPEVHNLYYEIETVFRQFADFCVICTENLSTVLENGNILPPESVSLGLNCELLFETLPTKEIKTDVRKRCSNFYISALKGILQRFNFNDAFLRDLKLLNPHNVDKTTSMLPLLKLHKKNLSLDEIDEIDREWRDYKHYIETLSDDEKDGYRKGEKVIPKFKPKKNSTSASSDSKNGDDSKTNENGNLNKDKEIEYVHDYFKFWINISEIKLGNEKRFGKLCRIVFDLFSLPHSSAAVERIFSQLNLNKTKTRNRLKEKTLTGILNTKELIDQNTSSKGCHAMTISTSMMSKMNCSMYEFHQSKNESNEEDELMQ